MIVLDASVLVEMLREGPLADLLWRELLDGDDSLVVPHLVDVEVISAFRRLATEQRVDPHHSQQVLEALDALPAKRYEHTPLLGRIWELRHNFTAYDATYIALAEATDSTLYTCDEKLAEGHRARVKVFA